MQFRREAFLLLAQIISHSGWCVPVCADRIWRDTLGLLLNRLSVTFQTARAIKSRPFPPLRARLPYFYSLQTIVVSYNERVQLYCADSQRGIEHLLFYALGFYRWQAVLFSHVNTQCVAFFISFLFHDQTEWKQFNLNSNKCWETS